MASTFIKRMVEKHFLKQVILEQKNFFENRLDLVQRDAPQNILLSPKIVVITGIRRCGKSTLLKELSSRCKDYGYVNFEDERFIDFTSADFNALLESFLDINPNTKTLFFDEIQNIKGWELFVRRLFTEGYKIFITGSNARLLSSEIATSLTGRNLKVELYPFSFKEYLYYAGFQLKGIYTTNEKVKLSHHLENYLSHGGFPEVVKSKDYAELNEIYQDIVIKDLLVRLKIRNTKDFRELALYLLSNVTNKIIYNNLKNLLCFSNTSKVKNYVDFLSEAYLFFTIVKYDPSLKKQIVSNRKVYAIDTGMINAVAFQFSRNKGKLMENAVFIELKRRGKNIYYFEGKNECDFLIKEGIKITRVIQVAENLAAPETKKREIDGLLEAMNQFKVKEGMIITSDIEKALSFGGKRVKVVPLWKWLLDKV